MFAEVGNGRASIDCPQGRLWNSTRQNRQDQSAEGYHTERDDAGVTPFIARGKRPLVIVARGSVKEGEEPRLLSTLLFGAKTAVQATKPKTY
jgi:hypothetical protein